MATRSASPARMSKTRVTRELDMWIAAVTNLVNEVKVWVTALPDGEFIPSTGKQIRAGRVVLYPTPMMTLSDKEICEEPFGTYHVPQLNIEVGKNSSLVLEPQARNAFHSDGRVDFYAYPTVNRVFLLREAEIETWIIRTESGIDWPFPWGYDTFLDLSRRLINA